MDVETANMNIVIASVICEATPSKVYLWPL
jgi:hypothetical protein